MLQINVADDTYNLRKGGNLERYPSVQVQVQVTSR